jgi:flagellin
MGASLSRIAANVPAMQSMNSLNNISNKISTHQLRLATGKRINRTGEDPAGYMLARGLESRVKGLDAALDNVSNAQNILDVAEGGYQNVMDILQTVKQKATQAADGSLNATQRTAIHDQVQALISEVDEIVAQTTFNNTSLIDGSYSGTTFQTGELAGETLSVTLQDADSAALNITVAADQATSNAINLETQASASAAITSIGQAIDSLSDAMKDVGEYQVRLNSKEKTLTNAITNSESVRSTIEDADFAEEQMEVLKLQILQQTSLSSLTQANSSPQLVLSMFR